VQHKQTTLPSGKFFKGSPTVRSVRYRYLSCKANVAKGTGYCRSPTLFSLHGADSCYFSANAFLPPQCLTVNIRVHQQFTRPAATEPTNRITTALNPSKKQVVSNDTRTICKPSCWNILSLHIASRRI